MNVFCKQRTLYVDNFSNIVGNPSKEDKLLLFAKRNNFKTLILYQLNKVDTKWNLTDPRKNNILSEFITKAKTKFSIQNVGASGESASFFTTIVNPYNNSRNKAVEKFDIYNLEYEYWSKKASGPNGYYCVNYLEENAISCTRNGSFKYFIANLKELQKLSKNNVHDIKIEAYLAFYSQKEISSIVKYCDRLIIQTSGKSPAVSYKFAKKSLDYLSKINSQIKTSILYSTKMDNMGYWFKTNSLETGEQKFFKSMKINSPKQRNSINFDGFSYHTYSFLEKSISYFLYSKN
jgi:hypothetical protein